MTNLLISAFLVGLSVTYIIELVLAMTLSTLPKDRVFRIASLPLCGGAMYLLGIRGVCLALGTCSSTFVVLYLVKHLSRQVTVAPGPRLPRL